MRSCMVCVRVRADVRRETKSRRSFFKAGFPPSPPFPFLLFVLCFLKQNKTNKQKQANKKTTHYCQGPALGGVGEAARPWLRQMANRLPRPPGFGEPLAGDPGSGMMVWR